MMTDKNIDQKQKTKQKSKQKNKQDKAKRKITKAGKPKKDQDSKPKIKNEKKNKFKPGLLTKENILLYFERKVEKSATLLSALININIEHKDQNHFFDLINELEQEGSLIQTDFSLYATPKKLGLAVGRLELKSGGRGYVILNSGGQDLFISEYDLHGAMDGDLVVVELPKRASWEYDSPSGKIVRVIKRKRDTIVGSFRWATDDIGIVTADDNRVNRFILVRGELPPDINENDKVVLTLLLETKMHVLEGTVKEILGKAGDKDLDVVSIIAKHGLSMTFPKEVLQEAESLPEQVVEQKLQQEINNGERTDLRNRLILTIDGEDAKDLDDAVSIERLENGNTRLGVHIADVAYYVHEGGALDREALERGCSVYLADRVIPMLPKRLSNVICSLNPHVDRLTLTCDMEIDSSGSVVGHAIYPSVIKTQERMTYKDVTSLLGDDTDPALLERYKNIMDDLRSMADLAATLNKNRLSRGAIDFDFPEAKLVLDDQGKVTNIVKKPRTVSERLIEEFMLLANETVAEHFHRLEVPFVYRVHQNPDESKLKSFAEFITCFGHSLKGKASDIQPKKLQMLLEQVKGKPEESIVSKLMLRTMQQAKYSTNCTGHYGLAAHFYSHFTSPIRRYPDLLIHRVIRELITTPKLKPKRRDELAEFLQEASEQSSIRERVAIDAEREVENLKKVEFMANKIGKIYKGSISSVTSFGFFVELPNTIEGLVHVRNMNNDYYHYDDQRKALIGERSGETYQIGGTVVIRVSAILREERKIDFELVDGYE